MNKAIKTGMRDTGETWQRFACGVTALVVLVLNSANNNNNNNWHIPSSPVVPSSMLSWDCPVAPVRNRTADKKRNNQLTMLVPVTGRLKPRHHESLEGYVLDPEQASTC